MEETPIIECDIAKCVECHVCETACKAYNKVEMGVKLRWVESVREGEYPNVSNYSRSIGCYHCRDAPCVEACPTGAITQDLESGVVVVNAEKCNGSRDCASACPCDVPHFGKDGKMQKCDLCFDIHDSADVPLCVRTCPSGALKLNRKGV